MQFHWHIVSAFTSNPYGGNPAAVVVVDGYPSAEIMQGIAENFNQSIVSYIRHRSLNPDKKSAHFDIRWFTVEMEIGYCGHATLAASAVVSAIPNLVPADVETLVFRTTADITAKRSGGWIEMTLEEGRLRQATKEEFGRLKGIVAKGLGKEASVAYIGVGEGGFKNYLVVEIAEADKLAECKVNPTIFLDTGFEINVFTSTSPDPTFVYIDRVFCPQIGIPEDQVNGSPQALLAPYWSQKLGKVDVEMVSRQASSRSGILKAVWHQDAKEVVLAGQATSTMKGELL